MKKQLDPGIGSTLHNPASRSRTYFALGHSIRQKKTWRRFAIGTHYSWKFSLNVFWRVRLDENIAWDSLNMFKSRTTNQHFRHVSAERRTFYCINAQRSRMKRLPALFTY
jgi:hypothetical protein